MNPKSTQKGSAPGLKHIISVDVEDYFQVEAFNGVVSRETWDQWPSRVVANTRRTLDIFDDFGVKGTFFVVGWVAEKFPQIVREINARGHELACHSYWHRTVFSLTTEEFRRDTRRSKEVIENASGQRVVGYRAPSWSITRQSMWALDVLAELGFEYDSSIYPIHHDIYGIPGAQRTPYCHKLSNGASLPEFPPATVTAFGATLPAAGGGYLRMFPFAYTSWAIRQMEQSGHAAVVYFHPWEIDPEQPRIAAKLRSRVRHYTRLGAMETNIRTLLSKFEFQSFRDMFAAEAPQTEALVANAGGRR